MSKSFLDQVDVWLIFGGLMILSEARGEKSKKRVFLVIFCAFWLTIDRQFVLGSISLARNKVLLSRREKLKRVINGLFSRV